MGKLLRGFAVGCASWCACASVRGTDLPARSSGPSSDPHPWQGGLCTPRAMEQRMAWSRARAQHRGAPRGQCCGRPPHRSPSVGWGGWHRSWEDVLGITVPLPLGFLLHPLVPPPTPGTALPVMPRHGGG